jgi:hypothetical protein
MQEVADVHETALKTVLAAPVGVAGRVIDHPPVAVRLSASAADAPLPLA